MRAGAALLAAVLFATAASAAEQVEIPLGEGVVRAMVFRPQGTGPFPAVIAMHGCAGLFNRSGNIGMRYSGWAERLNAAGFAVVFPDSFGSRGIGNQCTVRSRKARSSRERVADANATRRWLQGQEWVKADRVALLGWSTGATSVLWTVRPRAVRRDGKPDFRSAVTLYPGCRRLNNVAWAARIPTLVLIGQADDWTPAEACQQMVYGARGRSARTEIVVYPNAHHEFDHPNRPLTERSGLVNSANGKGRAHVGSDPAARTDALKRVPEWLGR
jgi:dienelactone hydrolase